MRNIYVSLLCFLIFIYLSGCNDNSERNDLNIELRGQTGQLVLHDNNLVTFRISELSGSSPNVVIDNVDDGWHRVLVSWILTDEIKQDELSVEFLLNFIPDFWWAPHLAPNIGDCIAQHVFRSPAIIAAQNRKTVVVVPDLEYCGQISNAPWFMDYDAPKKKIWLGMSNSEVSGHVGYRKTPGMILPAGKISLGFYITAYSDDGRVANPWRKVSDFLWKRYGQELYGQGQPTSVPLDRYVEYTYKWAFEHWKDFVWQEFNLNGKRVGAPQFIVNYSQSPNFQGDWFQREHLSVWNQAWFSSLRSAGGLARWAKRKEDSELLKKAKMTKELALSAPFKKGIFPSVIRTDNMTLRIGEKQVCRPGDWTESYWTNSNRCPYNYGITADWYHILDASWTSLLMLRWYEEIEKDRRLIDFAITYADFLLTLQDEKGYFPGWLDPETLDPAEVMSQTPETSISVTFLLKLAEITKDPKYSQAAYKAMDVVISEIIPAGRWEDFETYWSCSDFGNQDHVGRKYERNDMYKQNNLSIYWTAEALLQTYRQTGRKEYLEWGHRTLDELSMMQQVWQPPYIYIPAVGGFGVMNYDAEWNDSRQTLFAELFMNYYKETGDQVSFERGISALKAGFVMMYCPENAQLQNLWEKVFPFFGPEDFGFTMENYGHGGHVTSDGEGMGHFTIYDWGNGAAAEARNRIYDHYGDVYIDRIRNHGFGIDNIRVKVSDQQVILRNMADRDREIKIVFEDGSSENVQIVSELNLNLYQTPLR
jgi:hypothetical protein